jgi:N-formylglutamate amidohydrolase
LGRSHRDDGQSARRRGPDPDSFGRRHDAALRSETHTGRDTAPHRHLYHAAVTSALDAAYDRFGGVWHIDCHSTPGVWPSVYEKAGEPNPNDYALGDRDGTTASAEFTELVRETLSGLGYRVAVNDGQKGVELVRAYSDPAKNRHSLQIEINRRLYMDEDKIRKSDGYANQQAAMTKLIEVVCAYARDQVS